MSKIFFEILVIKDIKIFFCKKVGENREKIQKTKNNTIDR